MRQSSFTQLEQFLRTVCFFFFLAAAVVTVLVTQFLSPLHPFFDKITGNRLSRKSKYAGIQEHLQRYIELGMFKLFGINYIIENKSKTPIDKGQQSIVMFTHGSNLDPPLIHLLFPNYVHFISKKSLFKVPFIGKALSILGHIPIDRTNLQSAIKSLESAGQMVADEKKTVGIAPEGTRRRSASTGPDQLLPFKKGPFHLAKTAESDIIPITIIGANRLWPAGQPYPLPGTVVVRICEKIPKEEVSRMSIPELQSTLKERFTENLTPVDNRVIFNTDDKPYVMFIATLVGVVVTWTFFLRFFIVGH